MELTHDRRQFPGGVEVHLDVVVGPKGLLGGAAGGGRSQLLKDGARSGEPGVDQPRERLGVGHLGKEWRVAGRVAGRRLILRAEVAGGSQAEQGANEARPKCPAHGRVLTQNAARCGSRALAARWRAARVPRRR